MRPPLHSPRTSTSAAHATSRSWPREALAATRTRARGDDADDRALPRLALSKREAALAIGVSVDYLEEHVMPELRVVRRGRKVLVPVQELERWLDRSAGP